MFKWLVRKLGQLAGWSKEASDKVSEIEGKVAQLGWGFADVGVGFVAGIIFAKLVM